MKKLIYILALFFVLPHIGFTQNDSVVANKEATNYKNQIDFEIEFIGISFGYKKRVLRNWQLGSKIGFGKSLQYVYDKNGTNFSENTLIASEILHIGITLSNDKSRYWHYEIEPRATIIIKTFDKVAGFVGIGTSLFYGKKNQLGLRFMIGFNDSNNRNYNQVQTVLTSSLLIYRIPIKW